LTARKGFVTVVKNTQGVIMPTTGKITKGHKLFTEWALEFTEYPKEKKPTVQTVKKVLKEMNLYGINVEGYKLRKTHQGLWPYMVHSKVPCVPPKAVRKVIAYMSSNKVPESSWQEVLFNVNEEAKTS
tara:strand:+ start:1600 stop:1983 length:384 start_codon:yes stop_codon:yes gene_type:complete